ncbi:MAG: amidohydrolase family protein [bacterium]|nr:amidohydrolase family protein [bacterium]
MRIDAQQFCLNQSRFTYPWMPAEPGPLHKDYDPTHVEHILKRNKFDGMVLGPAHESVDETHWLLDLAARHPLVVAVVGWVDLAAAKVSETLDELERYPAFRGVKTREADAPGIEEVARRDLVLEVGDLTAAARIADRYDGLRLVVNDFGRPPLRAGDGDAWTQQMEDLARYPNVFVKVSGLVTRATRGWKAADFQPYVTHAMRTLGPERLMFGSDWPFLLQAVDSWKKVLAAFTQALGAQPKELRSLILGENAMRVYGIVF